MIQTKEEKFVVDCGSVEFEHDRMGPSTYTATKNTYGGVTVVIASRKEKVGIIVAVYIG